MRDIQVQILEDFCRELAGSTHFTAEQVQKINGFLTSTKKPKGADIAKVLAEDARESVP